jgi:hypothetical protein
VKSNLRIGCPLACGHYLKSPKKFSNGGQVVMRRGNVLISVFLLALAFLLVNGDLRPAMAAPSEGADLLVIEPRFSYDKIENVLGEMGFGDRIDVVPSGSAYNTDFEKYKALFINCDYGGNLHYPSNLMLNKIKTFVEGGGMLYITDASANVLENWETEIGYVIGGGSFSKAGNWKTQVGDAALRTKFPQSHFDTGGSILIHHGNDNGMPILDPGAATVLLRNSASPGPSDAVPNQVQAIEFRPAAGGRVVYTTFHAHFDNPSSSPDDLEAYKNMRIIVDHILGSLVAAIPPAGISFAGGQTEFSLKKGSEILLEAVITPDNATGANFLNWTNDKDTVVTLEVIPATGIRQSVKLKAIGAGTAKITVTTSNGLSAEARVTVTQEGETPLTIDLSALSLQNGILKLKTGDTVSADIRSNPAGASFKTTGLPSGLTLNPAGRLSGSVTAKGTYPVGVEATLNGTSKTEPFTIEVSDPSDGGTPGSDKPSGGTTGEEDTHRRSGGGCDAGLGAFGAIAALAGFAFTRSRGK